MQSQSLILVTNQQYVRDRVLIKLVNECLADWVKIREDDMAVGILR